MSDKNQKLDALAMRLAAAYKLAEPEKTRETDKIHAEGKLLGFTPIRIFQHGQNSGYYRSGPSEEDLKLTSLSRFVESWKAKNPSKDPHGPEFHSDLNTHVKHVRNFNFYE